MKEKTLLELVEQWIKKGKGYKSGRIVYLSDGLIMVVKKRY